MLAEFSFTSDKLGKQARNFVAWSTATGDVLRRMSNKSPAKGRGIALASPDLQSFPLEKIEVLHPRDRAQYPAILFARTRTQTVLQSRTLITGARERYTSITQTGAGNRAVRAAIIRHLPQEPSGISLAFGRRIDYPNRVGVRGESCVSVDLSGQVYAIADEQWGKNNIIDWIHTMISRLTHGTNVHTMPGVAELCTLGYAHTQSNNGVIQDISIQFANHPTLLE